LRGAHIINFQNHPAVRLFVTENAYVKKPKSKREVSFGFSIHVIEEIGPVVNRERTGLLEALELGAFEKRVWLGKGTGEEKEAEGYRRKQSLQNPPVSPFKKGGRLSRVPGLLSPLIKGRRRGFFLSAH
jgi:hypothetical protein